MSTQCVLVSGGAGFIGGTLVRQLLQQPRYSMVVVDKLTYAARLDGIEEALSHPRVAFLQGDIAEPGFAARVMNDFPVEWVVNLAAESHVDRSIDTPLPFLQSNVVGTGQLLEAARQVWNERQVSGRWLQVSTDEVYGSKDADEESIEDDPLEPSSPYAASKAAADLLVRAYQKTYGFPALITRCCNNYGPYQHEEKLIPQLVSAALRGKSLSIYGDGRNVREWIHVEDHCRALQAIMQQGELGQIYHIGSGWRLTNLEMTREVLQALRQWAHRAGVPFTMPPIEHVEDRPGHDRRYALDSSRLMSELGWRCEIKFQPGLQQTVAFLAEEFSAAALSR